MGNAKLSSGAGAGLRSTAVPPVAGRAALVAALGALLAVGPTTDVHGREAERDLDRKVRAFLERSRDDWRDLNVPYEDGQVLHDLVVGKGFKRGLEIGTSTGHSAIWIAWAMSKTGGKLTTIEIDRRRHEIALRNFQEAGVAAYVDARLGDAHQLVRELPGPFDFVFSDADKEWYAQYFKDVDPRLVPGGCFTAHNVLQGMGGIREFLDHVRSRPGYETTIDRTSRSGISISCKVGGTG
jgi:predicted O-methyltransferase YrrM